MNELALARFDQPHERRVFEKGTFELVTVGGTTLGRATYEPGWRWSEHVGRASGIARFPLRYSPLRVSPRASDPLLGNRSGARCSPRVHRRVAVVARR